MFSIFKLKTVFFRSILGKLEDYRIPPQQIFRTTSGMQDYFRIISICKAWIPMEVAQPRTNNLDSIYVGGIVTIIDCLICTSKASGPESLATIWLWAAATAISMTRLATETSFFRRTVNKTRTSIKLETKEHLHQYKCLKILAVSSYFSGLFCRTR